MKKTISGKAYISNDFWNEKYIPGYIHSVFSNVININFALNDTETRMLTLIADKELHSPDTVQIEREEMQEILQSEIKTAEKACEKLFLFGKENIEIQMQRASYDFGCRLLKETKFKKEDLYNFITYCKAPEVNLYKNGFEKLSYSYKRELNNFAEGLLCRDEKKTNSALLYLVGAGIGLTPTCDDALIGVLSVMHALALLGKFPGKTGRYNEIAGNMAEIIKNQKKKVTTDISLKYLFCALRGEFSLLILQLLVSIFLNDKTNFFLSVGSILEIGHSSGADMFEGIKTAINCFLARENIESVV